MSFYLGAVDDLLMTEGDNHSIGLILRRGKNGVIVEYALRDNNKPIVVADYTMLPPKMAEALPGPDVWGEALTFADTVDLEKAELFDDVESLDDDDHLKPR